MDTNDPSNTLCPGPELEIKFHVLRVSRDAPEEKQFINMLRGPEPEDDLDEGGFFVPIFGRGRALAAIPNSAIDDSIIDDACLLLLGACSCDVKHLNPGWDILFTFSTGSSASKPPEKPWQKQLQPPGKHLLPRLTSLKSKELR